MSNTRLRSVTLLAAAALALLSPPAGASPRLPGYEASPTRFGYEAFPTRYGYECSRAEGPWACLAECESSGRWDSNTGNNFYGGLQFHPATWVEHGGLAYAPRADLATREQQIKIAQKVLVTQGWKAWPVCSKKVLAAGLDGDALKPVRITHVVERGETLSSIARQHRVEGGWQALYQANRTTVGPRPDRIGIGLVLVVP
ncbi:transglycosylase family protein [Streptomyces silvensis]|nr:transglycosylase family protein [Streptomyces silvensis]